MRRNVILVGLAIAYAVALACSDALMPTDTGVTPPDSVVPVDSVSPAPDSTPAPIDSIPAPADTTPTPPEIISPAPDTVVAIWLWPDSVAVVDSIVVYPPRFAGGRTVQFCAFAQWSNGENGPTTNSQGLALCDSILAANPRWRP